MTSPTPRPDPVRLSAAEQAAIARIAGRERDLDPVFADTLARGPAPTAGRGAAVAVLAVVAVAALVVGAFVVPGPWLVAVVAIGVLVVLPTALVVWAIRQGTVAPDTPA